MTAIRTSLQNAFETTLTAEMGPNDLTATVASLGTLTSPCYVVIDMDDDAKREYILFDGTFGALQFVTSNINRRYLSGSAAGSNITHSNGATVRVAAVAQHIEDLHDRLDSYSHGDLQDLTTGDPHPQYVEVSEHDKGYHDILGIDAETFRGEEIGEVVRSTVLGESHGTSTFDVGTGYAIVEDVSVTIPSHWASYDVLVQASLPITATTANYIYAYNTWDAATGSERYQLPGPIPFNFTHSEVFTNQTGTGTQTASVYSKVNQGVTQLFQVQVTVIATRVT